MTTQAQISQLPPASLPLSGSEMVPIDQGAATTRVAVSALLAAVKAAGSNGQVQYNNNGALGGLTNAELTALISSFTVNDSGAVPAPGASSGKFLRDDGTWAAAGGETIYACTVQYSGGAFNITQSSASITAADFSFVSTGYYTFYPKWLPNGISWITLQTNTNSADVTSTDIGWAGPLVGGGGGGLANLSLQRFSGGTFAGADLPFVLVFSG
jgi:hypothetical protein